MEIVEAKQAFLDWNEDNFDYYLSRVSPDQQLALRFIPLLLQVNDRLLPGYNGPDTPAGIYGYLPDPELIKDVKQLYNNFTFNQDRPLNVTIIESVFLQYDVLSEKLSLWVVHIDKLKPEQFDELENKISRIEAWLKGRNLDVVSNLLTVKRLSKKSRPNAIFLDEFYYQSFLLAGKYPAWWLVPPDKESEYNGFVTHIKTARFVNEEEFIDLGGLSGLGQDDFLKLALKHAQNIYKSPDLSFLELLLVKQRQGVWPEIDGLACQLKRRMYAEDKKPEECFSEKIVLNALQQAITAHKDRNVSSNNKPSYYPKLFGFLSIYSNAASVSVLTGLSKGLNSISRRVDVSEYVKFNRMLFDELQLVYISMLEYYANYKNDSSENEKLMKSLNNMRDFITQDNDRVPVFIAQDKEEFILERMLLKHSIIKGDKDFWSFIIELDEGEEKVITSFDSLISLISWSLLNRIVDHSTQISIQCPLFMVKQTEARHIMEIMVNNVRPYVMGGMPDRVFERPNAPVRSILFFNYTINQTTNKSIDFTEEDDSLTPNETASRLLLSCEQLVVNSWGDVHVKRHIGTNELLRCLCDWISNAPLSRRKEPQELNCFGYGSGESTVIAQRIDHIYDEVVQVFYQQRCHDACLIVRIENEFYSFTAEHDCLQYNQIGKQKALYHYLEKDNVSFRQNRLEKQALPDSPLIDILQHNKKDVVQVFFQTTGRMCETWVIDEKGSMCHIQKNSFDRTSYIAHWLYVMRNINNQLKEIHPSDNVSLPLEISEVNINSLGKVSFHTLGSEDLKKQWRFIDVQVVAVPDKSGEKISLICEDRNFKFDQYGDEVVSECVKYISVKIMEEGFMPVYVTNVEAPLSLYGVTNKESIQTIHFLKYMRNVEMMLNKLIV